MKDNIIIITQLELLILKQFKIIEKLKIQDQNIDLELNKLKSLTKQEDDFIKALPQDSIYVNNLYDKIIDRKNELFDDEEEAILVLNRIGNILIDLSNVSYDKEKYNQSFDRYLYRNMIRDNYNVKFISFLENMKNSYEQFDFDRAQFMTAYYYKNISDRLINLGFNFNKLSFLSFLEEAREMKINSFEYRYLLNDELYDSLGDLFFQILERSFHDSDSKIIIYNEYMFRFLLSIIDEEYLRLFKESFDDTIVSLPENKEISKMGQMILDEFSYRKISIKDTKIEINNPVNNDLSSLYDNIILLFKTEEELYKAFLDYKDINTIIGIVNREKQLLSYIDVDNNNCDFFVSLLNDISIFLNSYDNLNINIIKKRIISVIPFFSSSDNMINHIINNLDLEIIERIVSENINDRNWMLNIYESGFSTDELIRASGNYLIIGPLGDDISSMMFALSEEEYNDKKLDVLFKVAEKYIDEIKLYLDDNLDFHYILDKMSIIVEKLDYDKLMIIRDRINRVFDAENKKMILSKLNMG